MKIISTEIKNLEPINTVAISHLGDYSGIGVAFEKLAAWAGVNNLWAASPRMAAVYHDDPMHVPAEKLRSEACLENVPGIEPGEGMRSYTISGGKYFVMQVEVTMSEYTEAWQKADAALQEKGYKPDSRDQYELYLSCAGDTQDANAPWVIDICMPVA